MVLKPLYFTWTHGRDTDPGKIVTLIFLCISFPPDFSSVFPWEAAVGHGSCLQLPSCSSPWNPSGSDDTACPQQWRLSIYNKDSQTKLFIFVYRPSFPLSSAEEHGKSFQQASASRSAVGQVHHLLLQFIYEAGHSLILHWLDCWLECATALLQAWCRSEIMLASNTFFPWLVKPEEVRSLSSRFLPFTPLL